MNLYEPSDTANGIDAAAARVRIRRGARAIGRDGDLGSVQQIIVDQETGELRGIVVQRARDGAEFEIPVDVLTRATSGEVRINLAIGDLDRRPDIARPYNPDQYIPVQPGDTAPRVQATRAPRDAEHPVVTSVEKDYADLMAPPTARATVNTTATPSASGPSTANQPTNLATPLSSSNATPNPKSDEQNTNTLPRHDAARADLGEETKVAAPPQEESNMHGVTGDLIGGKPTTGGMGTASTVPGSTIPSQDNSTPPNNPTPQGTPSSASAPTDDLTDLTDDELSNPDTALINAQPAAVDRIARPFDNAPSSADDTTTDHTEPTEQERSGMQSAFSTATNTSADDTYVKRAPSPFTPDTSASPDQDANNNESAASEDTPSAPETTNDLLAERDVTDLINAAPNADDLAMPLTDDDDAPTHRQSDRKEVNVFSDAPEVPTLTRDATRSAPTKTLDSPAVSIALAAAIIAGDILLRQLGARKLRAFGRGALLGAVLALVLAPMPGSRLRAQLIDAADHLRAEAA